MEGIGVSDQSPFAKGDIAHVLDSRVARASTVDLWSPGRGLNEVFRECGFFGPDTTAEGEMRRRGDVVRRDNVESCGADALVLITQVRSLIKILKSELFAQVFDIECRFAAQRGTDI